MSTQEALDENRFLAARDGMNARLVDPEAERRVPAADVLEDLLEACAPHAEALGCESELQPVSELARQTGAERQLELARSGDRLQGLVASLAESFCDESTRVVTR